MLTSISMVDNFVEACGGMFTSFAAVVWPFFVLLLALCASRESLVACAEGVASGCLVMGWSSLLLSLLRLLLRSLLLWLRSLPGTRCTAVCCVVRCLALFELTSREIVQHSRC